MVNGYQKKLRWASFAICYIIWQLSLPSGMAAHEWELKMIGDACSSDEECADFFSVCANGICSCDTAYRKMHFFSVTACNEERKLGDLCTSDKACTIPHSHCFMNTCVCKSGYIKELLSTQYSCTKYEVENHDITTLETNSSPKFEHLKLGFSKWPFIAAIVVALLILAICIYLCLRRPRRNLQQQPQPAVNYQSCPQASGGPVISGVSSQQVNYPPYPVTPGYPGYGGPSPISGGGGPLPAGGYYPSGAQGYYGPPKPGEYHGYPPVPAYPNYNNTSQTEQFQFYPPVSRPPVYGNPPQMGNYMCPPYPTGYSEYFQKPVPFSVSGASHSTVTSSIASSVHPSAPPDNADNRQDQLPPYYSTQGPQPVQTN